jgi:oligoendopeptidase F
MIGTLVYEEVGVQQETTKFNGPAWDNTTEYKSLTAPEIAADLTTATGQISEIAALSANFQAALADAAGMSLTAAKPLIEAGRKISRLAEAAIKTLHDIEVYASCTLSVDSSSAVAKELYGKAQVMLSRLEEANNPMTLFFKLCSEEIFEEFLKDAEAAPHRFAMAQDRRLRDTTLSLAEENLIIALNNNGPAAWGTLYSNLSGSVSVDLDLPTGRKKAGLAETASLLQNADESVRRAAFTGISSGWKANEESTAAILNALAGWRHEIYQRRSYSKPVHFLDDPLHRSRITRATLDAMMTAVTEARGESRRAMRLKAKALGKATMAPWDAFAPCPQFENTGETRMTYSDAISLIADGYGSVHPEMADFVRMMADRKWIEGTVGPKKRPGGYCTWYARSRTPRIYMTYAGGTNEVMTLAHELGHAFHSWVMRDLPFAEVHYPMTLAETASIFGETIVNNMVLSRVKSPQERLNICWTKARDAEAFLLNIPVRFSFEKAFYEKRTEKALTPDELSAQMRSAWQEWYGDTLSDYDSMFWASKLHFSISEISFYNFPYTFGYLFALGVYAQKDRLGGKFYEAYVNLLRDTGRMTAEEVAAKHLGADLTRPDFWRQSIAISQAGVDQLADALKAFNVS